MSAAVVENSGNLCQPIEERSQDVESEEESREFESMNSSTVNGEDDRTEDLEEEQIDPGSDKDEDDRFIRSNSFNSRINGEAIDEHLLASYKLSPDTNKLLRDIIQNRERKLHAMRLANGQSPLQINGDHNAMINQLLQEREIYRNGELNLDMSLVSQGISNNSDDSDNEMDKNQNKRSCSSPLISPGGSSSGQLSPSDPEAVKVKRARVENIVTGMRMSPSTQPKSESGNPPLEKRSNKRKQYQPQQHDVRFNEDDEPSAKRGRVEKDNLKDQLKQMQQQLVEMQQKYIQLFEKTSAAGLDTVDSCVNVDSFNKTSQCVGENAKETNNNNTKLGEKSKSPSLPFINLENKDMEPSHFIDQVCKLVKEQEVKISKPSANALPSKTSIEDLAKSIKSEIRDVISNTVDSVVSKFLQENKLKLKEAMTPEPPVVQEKLNTTPTPIPQMPRVSTPNKAEQKPPKTKVTDKTPFRIPDLAISNGFHDPAFHPLPAHHPFHPFPLFGPALHHHHAMFHAPKKEPEQTEALPLIVNTPKKKRTKVTDTRLSPRAARALLHENQMEAEKMMMHPLTHDGYPLIPVSLPTSVAIPNPGLQHSDIMAMHNNPEHHSAFHDVSRSPPMDHFSPNGRLSPPDSMPMSIPAMMRKDHRADSLYGGDRSRSETPTYEASMAHITSTLTPMHLRKAKLMFFFVRYPSSAILKVYFPDIKFNKNNTAQLVKWFSNFREFYYIQMEKYARQAIAEGVKSAEDLIVTTDCELYRVLNLHYNRNNQIEVPDSFRSVVQSTLREFFRSIVAGKDAEQSWKKSIYKVIARMDDPMPEFFKSANWMEQSGEQ
ncbi:prospero homeobox protein 1-like [Tubulanus polymorphus]|uniref:prospero homeobox protein 1-like n=1 Tax=Tubulanus polymorphus TaxID=672921 RepID=UPI003DA29A5C